MRRWIAGLVVFLLACASAATASAVELTPAPGTPLRNPGNLLINPILVPIIPINLQPLPVAFSAVANKYTGVDPATVFDLNGDLVGDVKISSTQVAAQNGAQVLLLNPVELNLDNVQTVPAAGYAATASLQLSRVYVAKLSNGYAKFMVLQASPKVTIWFHYGVETTSVLKADGTGSHAVLTWDPLSDATQGYNIYRYEVSDTSYTVTKLNDFAIKATTFTDNTARNRYYIYVVQALKAGGSPGSLTTAAPVQVTSQQRSMVIAMTPGTVTVDGAAVPVAVKPTIKNGLAMIPASLLTHAGVKVTFDAASGGLTMTRRLENVTYTVVMTIDSPDYTWNSTAYQADVPPYKAGSEVMVPLRVVAPVLGLGVTFNSDDMTATVGWFE